MSLKLPTKNEEIKKPTKQDIKKSIYYIKKDINYDLALVSDYVKHLVTVIDYAESKINEELPKEDDNTIEVEVFALTNHDEVKQLLQKMIFGDI